MGHLGGVEDQSRSDAWQSLLIGRTAEEIQRFQDQMASVCHARVITILPTTYQNVEQVGSDRVMVSKWSSVTLAAFRAAGATTADIRPQQDQQPASTPIRGEAIRIRHALPSPDFLDPSLPTP